MKRFLILIALSICMALSLGAFGCEFGGDVNLGGGNNNQDNTDDDDSGDNNDDNNNSGNDNNQDGNQAAPVVSIDGMTFTLLNGGYSLTSLTKSFETLTVPQAVNNLPVVEIGEDLLRGNKKITKVELPDTVTKISSSAFLGCTNLKNVNLGKVEKIGDSAFKNTALLSPDLSILKVLGEGCFASTKVAKITIPEGVGEIPQQAFSGCSILKTVTLPQSVDTIGAKAFMNCSLLESINLEKVYYVEEYSFQSCSRLGDVTLTNAKYIKDWAFASSGMKNITIGEKCEQVYMDAFDSCKSLQTITLQSADKFTWFFILETTGGTKYKIDQSTSYPAEWRNVWIKDPVLCRDFMSTRNHNKGCYIATGDWLSEHPM